MLTLENDQLVFRFPEVHPDAVCRVEFQRTLRIPDDNRQYPLPPGRGRFPVSHVDDYKSTVPPEWVKHGGVMLPMAQAEAMWLRFNSRYPFAVKIAAGKINAVSGEAWSPALKQTGWVTRQVASDQLARSERDDAEYKASLKALETREFVSGEQDYVTLPTQPWLDGFNVGKGKVRQFVAMPLGEGYTVEEQLTGEAVHGGLQIIVYPLKPHLYVPPRSVLRAARVKASSASASQELKFLSASASMGLAAGGVMTQKIYKDEHGYESWDQSHSDKCFVHLLNSTDYRAVTGKEPPAGAPTAADYTRAGYPWFEIYDEGKSAVSGAGKLSDIDSVTAIGIKKGQTPLPDNAPLPTAPKVIGIPSGAIRQGDF